MAQVQAERLVRRLESEARVLASEIVLLTLYSSGLEALMRIMLDFDGAGHREKGTGKGGYIIPHTRFVTQITEGETPARADRAPLKQSPLSRDLKAVSGAL